MTNNNDKQILVTVGTYFFDDLIKAIDQDEFYETAIKNGINKIIIQKGIGGSYIPINYKKYESKLNIVIGDLFKQFESLIKSSELVISHGGAGNILETLKNKKKIIVCINQKLMDNHQIELATSLEDKNYIIYCKNVDNISKDVNSLLNGNKKLIEYPEFNYDIIPNEIYKLIDN